MNLETLPVGSLCVWYPDANRTKTPTPAIITKSTTRGVLELTLVIPYAKDLRFAKGVCHIDDPYLKEHPAHATSNGTWDYCEGSLWFRELRGLVKKQGECIRQLEEAVKEMSLSSGKVKK